MTLSRPLLALLAALFLAAWLWPTGSRTLVRPDEGRYTEIAREMALSADYVTPTLNGLKYFEKPPLQYWATALAFQAFGQSDFAARWWQAATSLFGLWMVWLAVRALAGRDMAWVASTMLAAMLYYFLIAHINTTDMGLAAFMTLTLVGLMRGFGVTGQTATATRAWMVAAWAGAALGFLSKGLVAIVLPGAIFVIYLLITRQWKLLTQLEWIWGPIAFLAIAAPWPLLVQSRNPEWANFFFIYEHFSRFSSSEHNRLGSMLYFVPVLIVGLAPWTPALLGFLRRDGRQAVRESYASATINVPLLLTIWCVFQFVFFSVSQSKLPSYLLPITPAVAMLLAPVMVGYTKRFFTQLLLMMAVIPLSLFALVMFRDQFVNDAYTPGMVNAFSVYAGLGGVIFVIAIYAAYRLNNRGRRIDAIVVAAVLATVGGSVAASGYEALAASTSSQQLVKDFLASESTYSKADAFYSIGIYEQTVPPYLGRTLTLVDYLDEMGLGAWFEPGKVRFNFSDFAIEWHGSQRAYAVTDFDQLMRMDFEGLDYRVVAADLRRVIIARHEP
ncbi:MAG: glycosyltransferase family 39 protein [Rhizobacter sp.]|nr:glycosyltransferase family 39 protein [Burkholderiales bacterium]